MLPRHRTDEHGVDRIDLPYSNLAYGQYNADWPINQAVYVDYMIHGLRGYYSVPDEEFAAMYQKEPGVIVSPLNDLTHDNRAWGFPNGYFVAGLDVFSRALASYGHPRAGEVRAVSEKMREDLTRVFTQGSVKSQVVQLADGTWISFVPDDAMTPRRMLDEWYPTDVNCGPLHMSRLAAIDPRGWLTTAMLNDHEDNLFLNQWGAANEPIYNQQATAYLYRDEPELAIRAFYSMMAGALSHNQLTPLEHRWAWGQYYMPPSTDGDVTDAFGEPLGENELIADPQFANVAKGHYNLTKTSLARNRDGPDTLGLPAEGGLLPDGTNLGALHPDRAPWAAGPRR